MVNPVTGVKYSILPPEMQGVMFISGYRGYGKSFLASQADLPDNIAFFDFESKGAGINTQLNFGTYRAITQESGGDPLKLFDIAYTAFANLEKDRYTVVVFDNVSPFEVALNAQASNRADHFAERYGLNAANVKAGRFGGTRAVANFMISEVCAGLHAKGVRLVIAVSHIKPRWSTGGPIPNKYNVKGADRWQELSILTLLLIPGDKPPVPSALVQKEQLGTIGIASNLTSEQIEAMKRGDAGHTIHRRLPPKISECTFQKIRWYLSNPADFDNLKSEEVPSQEESDPFEESLNQEQFELVKNMASVAEREQREQEEILKAMDAQALQNIMDEMAGECRDLEPPYTPKSVQEHLQGKGRTCTIPQAVSVMNKLQEKTNG
jgi:hypothetical protein